ncbi:MAG: hypothetical protein ICV62_13990 [Cyanobacteria bacterium Co-bin13]|nr:hypothetical protein [Cyanobacteria bacterium Co-bin13]
MVRSLLKLLQRRLFWLSLLLLVWLLCSGQAQAGPLTERLAQFPAWSGKPPVQVAQGDLAYPDWMAGTWRMTTALVDLAAPLAPEIVTPGFESNRELLNQAVECQVRFVPAAGGRRFRRQTPEIVSDRAFNGLNLARAYLGDGAVKSVKVDPKNPNRQVTLLKSNPIRGESSVRTLESTVKERATETPAAGTFITSEVFQQVFRGTAQPYLNEVETTTAYRRLAGSGPAIEADQVTAIYLSPQDPDYFKAADQPVALYRYRLEFFPAEG